MNRSWRICVEEFEEAKAAVGVLGALAYVSGVVLGRLVALAVLLILGALALVLLPVALVVALAALCASGSDRAKPGVAKPSPPDPWLSG
jgi:hypothetical protein